LNELEEENVKKIEDFYQNQSCSRNIYTLNKLKYHSYRTPLTNIEEDLDKYTIFSELPGLGKNEVEIFIHNHIIEIKGEKQFEYIKKLGGFVRKKYEGPSYYTCIELPEIIDKDKIVAHLSFGLLKIIIPKTKKTIVEKRKIEIE
jgi:HSP20 family protein